MNKGILNPIFGLTMMALAGWSSVQGASASTVTISGGGEASNGTAGSFSLTYDNFGHKPGTFTIDASNTQDNGPGSEPYIIDFTSPTSPITVTRFDVGEYYSLDVHFSGSSKTPLYLDAYRVEHFSFTGDFFFVFDKQNVLQTDPLGFELDGPTGQYFSDPSFSVDISGGPISPIPLPSSAPLFGIALLAVGGMRAARNARRTATPQR